MRVLIYKPAKPATQSGQAPTKRWVLEFPPLAKKPISALMGWTGSSDTKSQIRLAFDSKEEAIAYAEKHGFSYALTEPQARQVRPKAYADNFKYDRIGRWTH